VNVLQAAFRVGFGTNAEIFLVLIVPNLGDLRDLEIAPDQIALDLEADDDMEVVGEFVRLDPDEVIVVDLIGGLIGLLGETSSSSGNRSRAIGRKCSQKGRERPT